MTTDAPTFETITVASHPAANAEQQALLDWAAAHPTGRHETTKTENRYQLPDPETGKLKWWWRCTVLAGEIDDPGGLDFWRHGLVAAGMTAPGLVAEAEAAIGNTSALGKIALRALHHAGEKLAADIGTALHLATEHYDLQEKKA